MRNQEAFVHESAIVHETVSLGEGTKVWHFCHIMEYAELGRNCSVGQNCFIGRHVKVGKGVKVQNNVSLYEGLQVEDDVFIGPSAVFTNVINPRSFVIRRQEFKPTYLEKGCTIGANATVLCGVRLGAWSMIGAGAVVTRDVKPYELVTGVPARHAGWVSRAGLRLSFNAKGRAQCPETGEYYKMGEGHIMPE